MYIEWMTGGKEISEASETACYRDTGKYMEDSCGACH